MIVLAAGWFDSWLVTLLKNPYGKILLEPTPLKKIRQLLHSIRKKDSSS